MSTQKHTPGPWEVGGTLATGQHCIVGDTDTVVALLPDDTMFDTYKPADARLIAAAPELLDALHPLAGLDLRPSGLNKAPDDQIIYARDASVITVGDVRRAIEAIDKATGDTK